MKTKTIVHLIYNFSYYIYKIGTILIYICLKVTAVLALELSFVTVIVGTILVIITVL